MKLPKLTPEVTRREYCIEVPAEAMLLLLDRERAGHMPEMLSTQMDDLDGVSDSDYNGHFGANIFYRVDAEDDGPEKHEAIIKLIRDYLA